jgi:hypothetical protein
MQKLIHFVEVFFDWIYDVLKWVLDGGISVIVWAFKILFEGFLTVVQVTVAALDLGSYAIQYAAMWGGLDERVAWFLGNLGIGTGLTILAGAIGIRMLLNLIPAAFTRV